MTSHYGFDVEKTEIRQLTVDDVTDEYVSWLNNPKINRFLEIRHQVPFFLDDVKNFVDHCLDIKRHHYGIFVAGKHVGNLSCSYYDHNYKWLDISNLIGDEKYQKTQLGKFCLFNMLDYLFAQEKFHRIAAGTYSNHFAGITLLTNLGFKKEGVLREAAVESGNRVDTLKFSIIKREWDQKSKMIPKIRVLPPPWI